MTLLRRTAEAVEASRRRALLALRTGRAADALHHARRLHTICPSPSTARLLAVCHLLNGDWTAALAAARGADRLC